MMILVQWCTDPPMPYEEIDAGQWAGLPFKPNPSEDDLLDSTKGWICAIKVDGWKFNGQDHYHVEQHPSGSVTVTLWNDEMKEAYIHHIQSKVRLYPKWKLFTPPENPRHGKWMSDELFAKHMELIQ